MADEPPQQQGPICPQCGAPATPDQEYCLECGSRLSPAAAVAGGGGRKPLIIVGIVVVLAGAGAAVAYTQLSKDDGKKTAGSATTQVTTFSVPATTPTVPSTTTGSTTTGAPLPPGSTSTGSSTTGGGLPKLPIPGLGGGDNKSGGSNGGEPQPPSGGSTPSTGVASWPSGKSAWTVILFSASSKSEGESKAKSAAQKTSGVGLLNSSNFSSLNPGYWVIFDGQSSGKSAAESKANSLRKQGFPQAYPRFVKPK